MLLSDKGGIQLASLVLVMKAREAGYKGPISRLNLVVANSAPFESEAWYQFIQELKDQGKHSVARVLAALGLQLKNLDEFGSLLRIEDEMQKVIQEEKDQWIAQARAGMHQEYLFPEMAKPRQEKLPFETAITDETFFDRLGSVIEEELDAFYFKARQEGLAEEAILAADAERGFDFLRLSMQRHDVVYTNPPYMGSKNMGDRLKKFVASAYPQGKRDLYAAFVMRCRELSKENGHVGMVTQQSWMFLRTFTDMRVLPEEKIKRSKRKEFTGLLRETTIETLAHLGPRAFSEISGEVVNICLFSLVNRIPTDLQQFAAFRLIGPQGPAAKEELLRKTIGNTKSRNLFFPFQNSFVSIPESPIVYWVGADLLSLLRSDLRICNEADVRRGLDSGHDERFVRFFWELSLPPNGWYPYSKGGGYKKWSGLEHWVLDWRKGPEGFNGVKGARVQNVSYYFKPFLTYSLMAQGSLGVRRVMAGAIPGGAAGGIFPKKFSTWPILASILNSRIISYALRLVSPELKFREGYVSNVPLRWPENTRMIEELANYCVDLKSLLSSVSPVERMFSALNLTHDEGSSLAESLIAMIDKLDSVSTQLHSTEGVIEENIAESYDIQGENLETVINETGIPAGWHSLIESYDRFPELAIYSEPIPEEVIDHLSAHDRICPSLDELDGIKDHLRTYYTGGPGAKVEEGDHTFVENGEGEEDEEITDGLGAHIPIPVETFIEELSQKVRIHPISIYWLLEEMRREEGLVCPPELKRHAEDYVSVMILRMLGHQWPNQVEAAEPLPDWVDDDGIIPLTEGLGEPTLLDRIRKRFGADFGEEKEAAIESEFANIVGKSLERWLEEDLFPCHVKQFKSRPIAWHIVSNPHVVNQEAGSGKKGRKKGARKKLKPAFSVMVHYHRFVDGDKGYGKLLLLKNKYLEKLMSQTRSELESLRGKGDDPKIFDRIAELDRRLVELEDFRERLERIQEGKDREARAYVRWKSPDEQPRGWRPDINDGVKMNIAPWERLGMFPTKKIVGKVEMGPE